jgi:hypothetical protein
MAKWRCAKQIEFCYRPWLDDVLNKLRCVSPWLSRHDHVDSVTRSFDAFCLTQCAPVSAVFGDQPVCVQAATSRLGGYVNGRRGVWHCQSRKTSCHMPEKAWPCAKQTKPDTLAHLPVNVYPPKTWVSRVPGLVLEIAPPWKSSAVVQISVGNTFSSARYTY